MDSLGRKIKTGWNFGILPSIAYDADYGFQGGLLTNVYYYGDGKQYPEYIHSIYVEAAYTTKHHGIFRVNYDSKYLIPGYRLTLDATYLPDAMCDFYGFNGYPSRYNADWCAWNKDSMKMNLDEYRTRVFYKYKRDLIRVAGDIEGTIYKDLKWNAGVGVLGYLVGDCDINMLNGRNVYVDTLRHQKALNPNEQLLYDKYKTWGLIGADEMNGGWHPYARAGITYDTRDKRQGPNKGIYTDLFFTYSAAFNAAYGQQAAAGYNHLQFNFTFRHAVNHSATISYIFVSGVAKSSSKAVQSVATVRPPMRSTTFAHLRGRRTAFLPPSFTWIARSLPFAALSKSLPPGL